MCAPPITSSSSAPAPAPQPSAPQQSAATESNSQARRVGRTFRSGSASQRGRGVLIMSRNPLGISDATSIGNRQSLLTAVPTTTSIPLSVTVGGY